MRLPSAKKPAPATTAISEPIANHSISAPVAARVVEVVEVVEAVGGCGGGDCATHGFVVYSQSRYGYPSLTDEQIPQVFKGAEAENTSQPSTMFQEAGYVAKAFS